jgi:hypothetical protein
LNAAFDANMVDGGSGNIIVVPEPASLALAIVAGCTGALRRRRANVVQPKSSCLSLQRQR